MTLPELLRQEDSPIGCACSAPCGKVDEMFEERGLEMVPVNVEMVNVEMMTMVTKTSKYPEC